MLYNSRKGEICFLGSISNILHHYYEEISEGTLLAKSAGYDFRITYDDSDFSSSLWLECVNFTPYYCDRLNSFLKSKYYQLVTYEFSNEEELKDFIKEKINYGIPIMISLDLYKLPYHHECGKMHFDHIVVIYDFGKNGVSISDCCPSIINQTYYECRLKWQELMTMMSKKAMFQVWCVEKSKYRTTSKAVVLPNNENKLHAVGVSAIYQLSELYDNLAKTTLSDEIKEHLQFHYCLFTGFGGPVVTRRLFHNYLIETYRTELALECLTLSKRWNIISKNLMKSSILGDAYYLHAFSSDLKDIVSYEETLIEKMY